MIENMSEREIERIQQVIGEVSMPRSRTKSVLLKHMGKRLSDKETDQFLLENVFAMAQVLARVEKAMDPEGEAVAPSISREDVAGILEVNKKKSIEAMADAVFDCASAAIDEAFRYGYYAALESENVTL